MPPSIKVPQQSWPCAYLFQRLLDIAALHPAGRRVAVSGHSIDTSDIPELTRAAVSTWTPWNRQLFLFCFHLHRALLDPNPSIPRVLPPGPSKWNVQPNLSIITDLPAATIAMSADRSQLTLESFQVARWAIALFSPHGIPITTPGGRGVWDALQSYRNIYTGWASTFLLQRLLEVRALHPSCHHVPIDTNDWKRDIPAEIVAAASTWNNENQKVVSFCFRLHRAFLQNAPQCTVCGSSI
ncbi:hypothetical protein BDP27DRAFT_1345272 [Rhodocollybia butyracea]|uniref:Uncharacterized protein n=1 Tax=Rhodocollybia butyracea TaxID=206335 RepID=A0A9P5TX62_9AGAR|nr:hypothetical protein BDP27DRAFT_1345272 [Rhodocollybia butyracea]